MACLLPLLVLVAAASVLADSDTSAAMQQRQLFPVVPVPLALPLPLPAPFFLNPFRRPPPLPIPGRPGLCPFVSRLVPAGSSQSASVCGNLCYNDRACPLGQKCCPTECGYSCFRAVDLTP